MPKHLLLLSLFIFTSVLCSGQDRCATEIRNEQLQKLGTKAHDHQLFNQWIEKKINEKQNQIMGMRKSDQSEVVYQVPVVVHIVHNGEPIGIGSNIPDQQVFSQIAVLNEDFRRNNPDAINTPIHFRPVAADVEIEFVLAKRAPNGTLTDGIVRVYSPKTSWHYITDEVELKSLSYWPAEDYINIWVVNQLSGGYIAYSTYPVTDLPGILSPNFNRLKDGIVIGRQYFGSIDKGSFELEDPYNKGRSLTHEMGHFLGLRHIWGDGGCEVDDYCDDTPLSSTSHTNCPTGIVSSCNSIDMYQNYMDYTHDRCMNLFTECQKTRMRTVMENSPRRLSLTTSLGLIPPEEFDVDLAVTKVVNPGRVSCDRFIVPEIEVTNVGKQTINNFILSYEIPGETSNELLFTNLELVSGRSFVVALDNVSFEEGQYEISVVVREVNNGLDINLNNNILSSHFLVNSSEDIIPTVERFHQTDDWNEINWSVLSFDNEITWELKRAPNGSQSNIAASINSFDYDNIAQSNWLVSPILDFSATNEAGLWFRYSYAFRVSRNDIFSIAVSTDCGKTFPYIIFDKAGDELTDRRSETAWVPQNINDWNNQYVDLSLFAGEKNIRVAFIWTNGNGNNFYLDDIEFFADDASEILVNDINDFLIFPNPSSPLFVKVALRLFERQDLDIQIVDAMGRKVESYKFQNIINQVISLPLPQLRTGLYIIWIKGNGINKAKRLLVRYD